MISSIAAGVPYVARPPMSGRSGAPVVLAWHLLDPPRTERAFAAAVPLDGLDAWRIHLGLPLSGSRLPEGGVAELFRAVMAEPVLNVQMPVIAGAIDELGAAFDALRQELGLGAGPVGVVGGSSGGAVAGLALLESGLDVRAAVLINPVVEFRTTIDALGVVHGMTYPWPAEAERFAERVDLPRRAAEFDGRAVLVITGEDDERAAVLEPAARLVETLRGRGVDVEAQSIPGLAHALADEPGLDPAPQWPLAHRVDELAAGFLSERL